MNYSLIRYFISAIFCTCLLRAILVFSHVRLPLVRYSIWDYIHKHNKIFIGIAMMEKTVNKSVNLINILVDLCNFLRKFKSNKIKQIIRLINYHK